MDTQHSVEIRWFQEGRVPQAITTRLHGRLGELEERTDAYLVLPACETVGVKLRGLELLEIKVRQSPALLWIHPRGAAGWVERWTKWSSGGGWVRLLAGAVHGPDLGWVQVVKRRRIGSVSVEDQGAAGNRQEEVALELAEVFALGRWCWSLALECAGRADAPGSNLLRVAEQVLSEVALTGPFTAEHSCSYPAWLSRLGLPS